jgi:DNA-directed RNA polymerase specialized sigma24 family protein
MTQPLTDQVPAEEPDPLDVIAQASDLATLDEELNQLPQKYRDVLVMSYFRSADQPGNCRPAE